MERRRESGHIPSRRVGTRPAQVQMSVLGELSRVAERCIGLKGLLALAFYISWAHAAYFYTGVTSRALLPAG